ncbi:MAG: class I SAM-dependent methyltransferase [Clostridia bacterium]|nr:class I SAM-dependent methyltransferase [Clostridia bacterium]
MDSVNKTLYIPLYGKSFVSKKGVILQDRKAEEIWEKEGFPLKGKSKSKWLAYFMAMRAKVFDDWLKTEAELTENTVVLHIGCGMDSRVERVGMRELLWYDVDFSEVIEYRKKYYSETEDYRMIAGDLRQTDWLNALPQGKNAIVLLEGVSMYLTNGELKDGLTKIAECFSSVKILLDCYSNFAAKMSKYKNPVNDVGVTKVYGLDDPKILENEQIKFVQEREMTPKTLISQLTGLEKFVFQKLYAGKFAKSLYKTYEYKKGV